MKLYGWTRSKLGVTLTEIMMAMAVSGILLAAIVSSFVSQQKSYAVQTQIGDMTINARTALDWLTRDIRLAGYGLPEAGWIDRVDWIRGNNGKPIRFTDPVEIMSDDKKPHQLILIGAFDRPMASLTQSPSAGATDLQLNYASNIRLDTRKRKLIYIGRNELALVTAIPRGRNRRQQNRISIDTNPNQSGNQGLAWDYTEDPILPSVELISVVTYKVIIDSLNYETPTPVLKRDTNTGGHAQPLAEHIEDLQFKRENDIVTITITARAANPDPNYMHPQNKDRYRRLKLSSQVKLRGLQY